MSTLGETQGEAGNRTSAGRVFLSYSSKEKSVASEVRDLLIALGHPVWFDRNIEYGKTDHWPSVVHALDACDTLLMLVSRASVRSEHVFLEVMRASGEAAARHYVPLVRFRKWFEEYPDWPAREAVLKAVILEDVDRDFGEFRDAWKQLPQAPDRGEVQETPLQAAWSAAVALSLRGHELEQSVEAASGDLARAIREASEAPSDEARDALIRLGAVPAIVKIWLARASVTAGQDHVRLSDVCQWEAPRQAGLWASWDRLRFSVRRLLEGSGTLELEDLRAFEDLGVATIKDALKELPRRPAPGATREASRYDLEISDRRLRETYPDEVKRWLDMARLDSKGVGLSFLIGAEAVHAGQEQVAIDVAGIIAEAAYLAGLDVETPSGAAGANEIESFFRGLIQANRGQRELEEPGLRDRVDLRPGDVEMEELRARLLLLAHRANRTFVDRRQQLETPISLDGWMTAVELNQSQLAELVRLIEEVTRPLARWVMESGSGGTFAPALGSKALGEALNTLKSELIGTPAWGEHPEMPRSAPVHLLRAESVQWLADLFWHSLVHCIPIYPTASELVIQATLVHDSSGPDSWGVTKPPARPGYRQIWPSRSVEKLGGAVTEAMVLPWRSNPSCRGLFRELAASLRTQFVRADAPDPLSLGSGAEASPCALAVSFSFDLELESALASSGDGLYHVAFPVVEAQKEEGGGTRAWGQWRWALATFRGPGGGRRIHDELLDRIRVPVEWDFLTGGSGTRQLMLSGANLKGPLILKMSGAPLLRLEQVPLTSGASRLRDRARAEPRAAANPEVRYFLPLAMGDYDNMQFLLIDLIANSHEQKDKDKITDAAIPRWLMAQLASSARHWLGIGISEQDWNVRMQLFVHATRANQASVAALFPDSQPSREAFLRSCGIQPVIGSLDKLEFLLSDVNRRIGASRDR